MKTKLLLVSLSLLVLFNACEGPEGPPGPPGFDGLDDTNIVGQVIEEPNIDFTAPSFEVFLDITDLQAFPSDVILVFFLTEVVEENGVIVEEIWRPLPMQIFHPNGLLNYNFDFAIDGEGIFDVRLFLDANFDLNTLTAIDTDDWVARIVVVPGDFVDSRVDLSDYNAVKELLNLPDLPKRNNVVQRRN